LDDAQNNRGDREYQEGDREHTYMDLGANALRQSRKLDTGGDPLALVVLDARHTPRPVRKLINPRAAQSHGAWSKPRVSRIVQLEIDALKYAERAGILGAV
jgi:hypothetical protein